ncbi:hypothetical protein imdm_69 [gamma proteobacterium IMCC2047]|nr:hypothetical protein imdm_69 [gamma proteobacterium IMCC2047]
MLRSSRQNLALAKLDYPENTIALVVTFSLLVYGVGLFAVGTFLLGYHC